MAGGNAGSAWCKYRIVAVGAPLNATLIVPLCGMRAEQFGSSWGGAAVVIALIHRPQSFQGRCKNIQYLYISAEYHAKSVSLLDGTGM